MPAGGVVPTEALATLRRRLAALPARHSERTALIRSTAEIYAVSRATLYRLLRGERRPRDARRADRGRPRLMPASEIERWCEIVAAMKLRTLNRKGRHLSTVRILDLLTRHGVETPDGLEKLQPDRLLAAKLKTPLQIGRHLVRAFEAAYELDAKPVDVDMIEAVLSRQLDDLEPRLTRNGYDLRSLVDQFDAKPGEVRRLLRGELDAARAVELLDQMRAAGLPT